MTSPRAGGVGDGNITVGEQPQKIPCRAQNGVHIKLCVGAHRGILLVAESWRLA